MSPLGLLNATRMYSDGMSVVMWIGRVGSGIGAPCGDSAPEAGSIASAVTWWLLPTRPPVPEALSLDATYRIGREACGQQ